MEPIQKRAEEAENARAELEKELKATEEAKATAEKESSRGTGITKALAWKCLYRLSFKISFFMLLLEVVYCEKYVYLHGMCKMG